MSKFVINKLIHKICIMFPAIYLIGTMLSDSIGRILAQLMILLLFVAILLESNRKRVSSLVFVVLFVLINAIQFGVYYVAHQDFYGFIFLILMLLYYRDTKKICKIEEILINKSFGKKVIVIFYLCLLFSLIFGEGLRVSFDWGVKIPMLYGPFALPHTLAYLLLAIYAMSSILLRCKRERVYFVFMVLSFVCIIWTGVRSVLVVSLLMVFLDFVTMKSVSKKMVVFLVGTMVLVYLLLFTDIITQNPVVQKTLIALGKGSGITNSRTDFNSYVLEGYWDMGIVDKIFGIGMDGLRKYMCLRYGTEIHAHNDFLNSLAGMGFVGLCMFVIYMYKFCGQFKVIKTTIVSICLLAILAYTNGLFMYIGFIPCIPVTMVYSKALFVDKKKTMGEQNAEVVVQQT